MTVIDLYTFGAALITTIGTLIYVNFAHPKWLDEPCEVGFATYIAFAAIIPVYGWETDTAPATIISLCVVMSAWILTGSGRFGGVEGPFGSKITAQDEESSE